VYSMRLYILWLNHKLEIHATFATCTVTEQYTFSIIFLSFLLFPYAI
jgi:hypothetical protein